MRKYIIYIPILIAGCMCSTSPGNGEKIGQVVKLSKVGVVCDTWEGQLIRGGMSQGSGGFGVTPFDFTISDDRQDLAEKTQKYMEKQVEVKIKYHTSGITSICSNATENHFLVDITPLDTTKK